MSPEISLTQTPANVRHGSNICQPPTRRAGVLKGKGQARYAADHHHHGMLHAVMAGLAAASKRIDAIYETHAQYHNAMEPHAIVVVWDGDGLSIDTPSQGLAMAQGRIAGLFGIAPNKIHIRSPYLGGGFGSKGLISGPQILGILAARLVGQPVKLVLRREHMYGPVGHRAPTRQTLRIGIDGDGLLTAIDHHARTVSSTFDDFFEPAADASHTLYASPAISTSHEVVRMDPVRRCSRVRPAIRGDGSGVMDIGAREVGQGACTALAQIAADGLGLEEVDFRSGTSDLPDAGIAGGSAHTATAGMAIHNAGAAVIAKLADLATGDERSPLFGAGNAGVTARNGRLFRRDDESRSESYADILSRAGQSEIDARGKGAADPGAQAAYAMHAHGAVFAEVKVDPDLGQIRATRLVGAFAAGRVINPRLVRSPIYSGGVLGGSFLAPEQRT